MPILRPYSISPLFVHQSFIHPSSLHPSAIFQPSSVYILGANPQQPSSIQPQSIFRPPFILHPVIHLFSILSPSSNHPQSILHLSRVLPAPVHPSHPYPSFIYSSSILCPSFVHPPFIRPQPIPSIHLIHPSTAHLQYSSSVAILNVYHLFILHPVITVLPPCLCTRRVRSLAQPRGWGGSCPTVPATAQKAPRWRRDAGIHDPVCVEGWRDGEASVRPSRGITLNVLVQQAVVGLHSLL